MFIPGPGNLSPVIIPHPELEPLVQKPLELVVCIPRNCEAGTDLQRSENSFNHLGSGELNHAHSPEENIKLEDVIVAKNL
jgi:hypothetical protein